MPVDFHHNIFYFYKGGQEDDNAKSRQLEDNTTKALINILENIDHKITAKFLRHIGVIASEISNVNFCLQKNDIGTSALQRKNELILLAIVQEKKKELKLTDIDKHHSRPDAWIYGDSFAILVESKVVGYLDYSQMRAHYRKLSLNSIEAPVYNEITWNEVHLFFKNEVNNHNEKSNIGPTNIFLLKQFTEYLDMCNLTDFNGFDSDFFDYFFAHDDEDSRLWVKKKIKSFSSHIYNKMSEIDSEFYQDYDQGQLKLKDNYSWVAFGPKNKEYRNLAHQTIRFNSQGLDIFINVELKKATDNFKAKIVKYPEELKQAIENLCDGQNLTFLIEKREYVVASRYNYFKLFELKSYSLTDSKLSDSSYNFLLSVVKDIDLPAISIIEKIHRNDAIEASSGGTPKKLVDKILKITTKFHEFISFINAPAPGDISIHNK